jgi:hypothetical protein
MEEQQAHEVVAELSEATDASEPEQQLMYNLLRILDVEGKRRSIVPLADRRVLILVDDQLLVLSPGETLATATAVRVSPRAIHASAGVAWHVVADRPWYGSWFRFTSLRDQFEPIELRATPNRDPLAARRAALGRQLAGELGLQTVPTTTVNDGR